MVKVAIFTEIFRCGIKIMTMQYELLQIFQTSCLMTIGVLFAVLALRIWSLEVQIIYYEEYNKQPKRVLVCKARTKILKYFSLVSLSATAFSFMYNYIYVYPVVVLLNVSLLFMAIRADSIKSMFISIHMDYIFNEINKAREISGNDNKSLLQQSHPIKCSQY